MPLVIGLTFDLKSKRKSTRKPPDHLAEFDSEETISSIEEALKKRNHKVIRVGSASDLLEVLPKLNCDIIFNIAEGLYGRNRESQVPLLLEMSRIPYVGSDALTLSLSLDKAFSKKVFKYHGISTPPYFECRDRDNIAVPEGFDYPLIVKPRYEGSGKGITPNSRVEDHRQLAREIRYLIDAYRQPALIEKFISGWEFTVGMIGNKNMTVFPVVQRHVEARSQLSSHIFEKSGYNKDKLRYQGFLEIEPALELRIKNLALEAFRALDCRDFARMDFRVAFEKGLKIYLLEINPLPSLAKDDYFAMVAELSGISYDDMINMILDAALQRYICE